GPPRPDPVGEGRGGEAAPRRPRFHQAAPHRAPPLGHLHGGGGRAPLQDEAHLGEAPCLPVPADAQAPQRALGGDLGRGRDRERRADLPPGARPVHVYPGGSQAPPEQPRRRGPGHHRGPDRQLSRRRRHPALRRYLRTHQVTKRVHIRTFGCQMNEYDSGKMLEVLAAAEGYIATDDPAEADLLLLNSCSVREKAQERVFTQVGLWKHFKQMRPGVMIGVGGCVASQEGGGIVKRAPVVDLVFGPQTLHRLPEMLAETRRTGRPVVDVSFPEIEKFDRLPPPRAEGATAFVSIMEGCSKYCSFCVVPYT